MENSFNEQLFSDYQIIDPEEEIYMDTLDAPCQSAEEEPIEDSSGLNDVGAAFAEVTNEKASVLTSFISIVLDGANIGWSYGIDHFDVTGLRLALKYFESLEKVQCTAFLSSGYIHSRVYDRDTCNLPHSKVYTSCSSELKQLVENGLVTVVPAGDYDDNYILSYARKRNGFVVSNDHFKDHIDRLEEEGLRTSLAAWLRESRVGYTFVGGREFMVDPSCTFSTMLRVRDLSSSQQLSCNERSDSPHHLMLRTLSECIAVSLALHQSTTVQTHCLPPPLSDSPRSDISTLIHLLLARVHLLIGSGDVNTALCDVEFILFHLNSECVEARELFGRLRNEIWS